MYELKVEASFEAAHRLPDYNGPCRRVHGHHWRVQAAYRGTKLDNQGMVIDLVVLRRTLRGILAVYDHQSLNGILNCVPTAENLARVIFTRLKEADSGIALFQVAVEETPGAAVIYREDDNAHK